MLRGTDTYLVSALQHGDEHAFEILFDMYYSILCRYARSIVLSDEIAEDLVTDLFIKVWEQPQLLSVNHSLKGYLFRSIHNSCINYLTRIRPKFQGLDSDTADKLNALMPQIEEESALVSLIMEELNEKVDQVISKLPPECARIFIMSRKDELSHKEIAQQLNISENTVKVQIYRALSKLREALKEYL